MTHRPYPNVDRALAQLNRHAHTVEMPEWRVKLAADARRALAVGGEAVQPILRAVEGVRAPAALAATGLAQVRHAV
ncbi:hypothetical protein [Streptomyces sp. SR-10]|uniref:hypothetical protein n=1 Tax=Streptomyces sp. SR-10 TaxID=3416442 RepID=UPI003CEFDB2C